MPQTDLPFVSIITVVHKSEHLIENKIKNFLTLDYPTEKLELLIYEDGATQALILRASPYLDDRIRLEYASEHLGKIAAMNAAVSYCRGDILIFSDADALLDPFAIKELVRSFTDSDIGGVCGRRIITERHGLLNSAQVSYVGFDEYIRSAESRIGSTTSNDGKIYAIRRSLYVSIPPAVTDDLFVCLSIVRQGNRFVFNPRAKAFIQLPSRNPAHELDRRRRIVSTSLRGIYILKDILNPFRFGLYSIQLFINKVLRRILPLFLLGLFISSSILQNNAIYFRLFFWIQASFYSLALLYSFAHVWLSRYRIVARLGSLAFYFFIGNLGSFLGIVDFLRGKKIVTWKPLKTD